MEYTLYMENINQTVACHGRLPVQGFMATSLCVLPSAKSRCSALSGGTPVRGCRGFPAKVKGQQHVKRAVEVSAARGHNLLCIDPIPPRGARFEPSL
jgi:hypothetical protein